MPGSLDLATISHSQATNTRQSRAVSLVVDAASRSTLRVNFSVQNPVLLFGVVATLHPG